MEVHHQAKAKRWFLALAEFGPVVTNAFLKKSDPVPPAEIERALAALSDWRARGGDREA
ncbi:MAG: hypothetical protein HY925_12135 [Elusimicrobia bacterium]|nr:hypothetical protein [Elusimicrobiota bacterium]